MNVLLVATPGYWRGGEVQMGGTALQLQRMNLAKPVVLCRKGSKLEDFCRQHEIEYCLFKSSGLFDIQLAFSIKKTVKKSAIDIIHANDARAITATAIACTFLGVKIPTILSRRIMTPVHNNWFSKYKYNHKLVSGIICDSKADLYGLSPTIKNKKLLSVIYPFVETGKFNHKRNGLFRKELGIADDEVLVGNVSALTVCKDIDTNINVAEYLLKHTNIKFRFVVVGEGKDRERLAKIIERKNLGNKFILTGFRSDIPEILPELDIFLFTSQSEGFGLAIVEAQLSQIPVVATEIGGIPEVINNRETGLLAPSKDYLKLSEAVMELIENKELKEKLIKQGRESALRFSPQHIVPQIAEVYNECYLKSQKIKKKILIDLSILKHPYCGLGQIALNYGEYFKKYYTSSEEYELYFLLPRKMFGAFGNDIKYIATNLCRKLFPTLIPEVDVWHAIHQLTPFKPFSDKTKYLLTIHDFNFVYEKSSGRVQHYLKKIQHKIYRADKITSISHFVKQEGERYMDLKGKSIEVIYNGVERLDIKDVKRPNFAKNNKPFFFSIGQIREKKNFHVLLPLMKLFPDKELYIAGEKGTQYSYILEHTIRKENLTNVHLLGVVNNEERAWLYKHCEAFLFPSLLEGFGLPVIEAMLFGKPVFSSKETSLMEIGGQYAFFWDNFEPEEMKRVIDENLGNFYQSLVLAERNKDYAFSFSYEKHIERYLDIYLTI